MEFNPFNPSVTHDFPSNSIPMTDQPDARTQRHATNSDQATTNSDQATTNSDQAQSPQEHKSTMQKIKEMIPGTKARKAKKAQKAGVPQDQTGMIQDDEGNPMTQDDEGNQMQQPTSDPEARDQMASGMGGTPSMEDSSSDPRPFFQYVQNQWQRMEVMSHEADLSKNDTSMGTSSMGTSSMMSPSLDIDPLAEQNVYAGNTGHPIGMDDRHLTYGSTVDTRGPGLQHRPLGGTHAQTGTLHRTSEALPTTDKESRKADYTGTDDTGSGLKTTRGVEQV